MEFFSKYVSQIRAQLAGLTMSQKLLIGLLIVVMIGVIFGVVVSSAKPEMVVLIPQAMAPDEINRVVMYLKGKYEYQVEADKVLVPSEKAYAIRGELFAAQALPKDTTVAFAELIKSNTLWDTNEQQSRKWNYATQEVLTKMLRYFPYIEDGTVVIARGEKQGIGRDAIPSSASVTVKVRNNEGLTGNQVTAIVDMIRGAVPGLKREDVHVTDGQRVYHAPSGDTPMPTDLLAYKKSIEDELTRKLWIMFADVGNIKIAVNVVPDMTSRVRDDTQFNPKVVKAVKSETTRETTSSEGSGNGGEPGVKSNGTASATDAGAGRPRSSQASNDATSTYENYVSRTEEKAVLAPGTEIKDMTASISLPRSYFLAIYRRIAKDPKADPEDDKLQPVIDTQLKQAQARAKNTIGAKSDEQIRVDWFDDTIVLKGLDASGSGAGLASSGSIASMVSQYAKQAVLGAVALAVLGMMLMMVRRAVPSTAGNDIDPSVFFGNSGGGSGGGKGRRKKDDPAALDVGDDVFGEAGEGDAVLTGIELDDETLQSRKMVDEVSLMVKENPENAAALVKRWMQKGK